MTPIPHDQLQRRTGPNGLSSQTLQAGPNGSGEHIHRDEHSSKPVAIHQPCPDCGSSDALAQYDDLHTHCFSCGKTTQGAERRSRTAQVVDVDGLNSGPVSRRVNNAELERNRFTGTRSRALLSRPPTPPIVPGVPVPRQRDGAGSGSGGGEVFPGALERPLGDLGSRALGGRVER